MVIFIVNLGALHGFKFFSSHIYIHCFSFLAGPRLYSKPSNRPPLRGTISSYSTYVLLSQYANVAKQPCWR